MRSMHQTALRVVLAISPIMGIGCISISAPSRCQYPTPVCNDALNSARMAEERGNLLRAQQLYEEAHKKEPQNAECLHRLGVISMHLNRLEQAEVYYRKAYKLSPNNAELLSDMGYSAFLRKDLEQSEAFLQQSIQLNDKDPRTIANLAVALAWRGKDAESLAFFRRVNGEFESRQRLAAIQIARGSKSNPLKEDESIRRQANAPRENSKSSVQLTAYESQQFRVELPAPSPMDPKIEMRVALPVVPSSDMPMLIESQKQAHSSTAVIVPGTPIELPPLVPNDSLFPSTEPNRSHRAIAEASEIDVPAMIPLPPAPPVDARYSSTPYDANEFELSSDVPPLIREEHRELIEPKIDNSRRDLKPNKQAIWRKSRQSLEEPDNSSYEQKPESAIHQTSGGFEPSQVSNISHGICLVTLLEEMRPSPGRVEFEAEFQSQKFRFSSRESLEKFCANPQRYVPIAGGVDLVSLKNGYGEVQGSYNFALKYQRQLYLFASREHAEEFRREPNKYVSQN